jgi:membrane protein
MSVQAKKLNTIRHRIRKLREREATERHTATKWLTKVLRWLAMLHHEFLNDDVRIRAESMSFLMLFSLLPLIAGLFFLFSVFTQFGLVQDALQDGVTRFLMTIPEGHRDFVQQYVLRFKDAYLSSLQQKSGSIGIFALFILIWVGLQLFRNVDKVLNDIWSSDRTRPFFEQVRNFLVISVAAPLVLIATLSVPLILKRTPAGVYLFETIPVLAWMMNTFLTPVLLFGTFALMYRFVPVRKVRWRSALWGAVFSTVALILANLAVEVYFRIGTQSAYGKAAAVPILGFWMYLVWIIVILGAEVSYLVQNGRDLLVSPFWDPTLREAEGMLAILVELHKAHKEGTNPVEFERLMSITCLHSDRVHGLLDYLERTNLVLECAVADDSSKGAYALARDLGEVRVGQLLGAFFQASLAESSVARFWNEAVGKWTDSFGDLGIAELAADPAKKRSKPKA